MAECEDLKQSCKKQEVENTKLRAHNKKLMVSSKTILTYDVINTFMKDQITEINLKLTHKDAQMEAQQAEHEALQVEHNTLKKDYAKFKATTEMQLKNLNKAKDLNDEKIEMLESIEEDMDTREFCIS